MTAVTSPAPLSLVLGRALVNIADYLAIHPGAQVLVCAPEREFLREVPSQKQCKEMMGNSYPSLVERVVKWRLCGVEGLLDVEELINRKHPNIPKLYFVSVLSDGQTEIVQKADPSLDHEVLFFAWEGEITQVIIMRVTVGHPVSHQYIAVAIRS